jgi:hypothetical protein
MSHPQPIAEDWPGETVFVVAGGPSIKAHLVDGSLDCLKGRNVVAVNSSMTTVARFAQVGFFADERWLKEYREGLRGVAGRLVTISNAAVTLHQVWRQRIGEQRHPNFTPPPLTFVRKVKADVGISTNRIEVAMKWTSIQGALNVAAHMGAARIVLVGADMGRGASGECHHHAPYPWPVKAGCWDLHIADLEKAARVAAMRGIEIVTTSPTGRLPFWPYIPLEDCL